MNHEPDMISVPECTNLVLGLDPSQFYLDLYIIQNKYAMK